MWYLQSEWQFIASILFYFFTNVPTSLFYSFNYRKCFYADNMILYICKAKLTGSSVNINLKKSLVFYFFFNANCNLFFSFSSFRSSATSTCSSGLETLGLFTRRLAGTQRSSPLRLPRADSRSLPPSNVRRTHAQICNVVHKSTHQTRHLTSMQRLAAANLTHTVCM